LIAGLLVLGSGQAAAQSVDNNARCLLVSNLFANAAKEAKAKEVANAAKLFYGGRVSALPTAQISAALAAQHKQVTPANAGSTMNACAQAMERALKNIQAASASLQPGKR